MELRGIIKEGVVREWQGLWEKETKGRHYFSFHPQIKNVSYCYGTGRDSVKIYRLRLGHCGLNQHLHIIGKHPTGLCECGCPETVKHVLLECSKYSSERKTFYKRLSDLGVLSFSIKSFFGQNENHQMITKAVLQLLHDSGLYKKI